MRIKFFICLLSLVLFSCIEKNDQTVSTPNSNSTLEGDTIQNDYATSFRIINYSEITEIQILNIDDRSVEFNYYFSSSIENIESLKLNPQSVVALSSTHLGMLEELELLDRIVGISDDKYLCSSKLKKRVINDLTMSLGDIGTADVEGFVEVDPDLVIFSGFDTKAPVLKKLEAAGIETFTNYDWKETHPLGRAEWLKVFGVIFDKREEANKIYDKIKREYLNLLEEVRDYSSKETVLVGTLYGDVFNAPAGDSYMAKLLEDANLNYKYQDSEGTGSISLTLEEVISDNRNTNIWLNVAAQSKSKVLEMNNRFGMLESMNNNRVYSYYHEVNCFWEKSAISPHLLLLDICKIAYPEEFKDRSFSFYNQLE